MWESESTTDVSEEESAAVDLGQSPAIENSPDKSSSVKQEKKKQSSLFMFMKK